jgi:hypothetical protein
MLILFAAFFVVNGILFAALSKVKYSCFIPPSQNSQNICKLTRNNARDTTNFTTKYLQTDMAFYVEGPH